MRKTLRFGATYLSSPIFNATSEEMGYEELGLLDLPEPLLMEIKKWDHIFQITYCDDYPSDSGFKSVDEIVKHNEEGLQLWMAIQNHFASRYVVEFIPLKPE